ncbi:molecular chaperone HtpG [uncultured Sutterella sp.]|uniref:molecular chaperone HtpG n=1 Tax=uncultured Sutterella sp. TaxID=286133 RepID=UPI00266F030C|nr:molecular chaperone HtpG [uncultured Sutterella sp.]
MAAETHVFQTKVSKLLKLLANSLYSNKEVFLRELVSNASDAIDKLRFAAIAKPELLGSDPVFSIRISADKKAGTLTVSDNGIGMTLEEANEHLGTIAQSGTEDFLEHLSADEAKNAQQIGQFGVGFYSSFIVADRVTVVSRAATAGENEAVRWESDGSGTFTSELTTRASRGTDVILHLRDEDKNFLDPWTLRETITKYSDHISTPVYLLEEKPAEEGKTPEKDWVQVNDAKALWTLPPKEVTDDQYKEFYKHLTHDWEDPLCWAHNRVEGDLEYTSLLYCPSVAPYDLYNRDLQKGLKLFVERVFIMDRADAFLPNYLRFIKGLVDTNDLPLNVSRELLQESRVAAKLKKALTRRALDMFAKLADDKEKYGVFWTQFGRVLKEGIVEDPDNKKAILGLLRFATTKAGASDITVSLADYVSRMPEGQKNIYYVIANTPEAAEGSPYLEGLKKKGVEVLLLWERIDEWMMGALTEFDGHKFIPATAADLELEGVKAKSDDAEKPSETSKEEDDKAVARFKAALGEKVADVRVSDRLVDSAACVVGQHDQMLTEQMRRMLEAAGQTVPEEKYTLEVNLESPLVKKALAENDPARFSEWADVILDQALLSEQGSLKDPAGFVKRLNALLLS